MTTVTTRRGGFTGGAGWRGSGQPATTASASTCTIERMRTLFAIAMVTALAGCSKSDPPKPQSKVAGTATVAGKDVAITGCSAKKDGNDAAVVFTLADGTVVTRSDEGITVAKAGGQPAKVDCAMSSYSGAGAAASDGVWMEGDLDLMDCGDVSLKARFECH